MIFIGDQIRSRVTGYKYTVLDIRTRGGEQQVKIRNYAADGMKSWWPLDRFKKESSRQMPTIAVISPKNYHIHILKDNGNTFCKINKQEQIKRYDPFLTKKSRKNKHANIDDSKYILLVFTSTLPAKAEVYYGYDAYELKKFAKQEKFNCYDIYKIEEPTIIRRINE